MCAGYYTKLVQCLLKIIMTCHFIKGQTSFFRIVDVFHCFYFVFIPKLEVLNLFSKL